MTLCDILETVVTMTLCDILEIVVTMTLDDILEQWQQWHCMI